MRDLSSRSVCDLPFANVRTCFWTSGHTVLGTAYKIEFFLHFILWRQDSLELQVVDDMSLSYHIRSTSVQDCGKMFNLSCSSLSMYVFTGSSSSYCSDPTVVDPVGTSVHLFISAPDLSLALVKLYLVLFGTWSLC